MLPAQAIAAKMPRPRRTPSACCAGVRAYTARLSSAVTTPATSGTVMVAALPVLVGVQLVLAFLSYDLQNVPRDILHRRLEPAPSKS